LSASRAEWSGTRRSRAEQLIEASQWDGSDFFTVWPVPHLFVTSRVAELIRSEGLRGARLIRLKDFEYEHVLTGATFEQWMPDDRVREINALLRAKIGFIPR
jgi:hypothetical protein